MQVRSLEMVVITEIKAKMESSECLVECGVPEGISDSETQVKWHWWSEWNPGRAVSHVQ